MKPLMKERMRPRWIKTENRRKQSKRVAAGCNGICSHSCFMILIRCLQNAFAGWADICCLSVGDHLRNRDCLAPRFASL